MHPLLYHIGAIKLYFIRSFAVQCPRVVLDWCADTRDIGIYNQSPADAIRVQHVFAISWSSSDYNAADGAGCPTPHERQLLAATRSAPVPHVHVVRAPCPASSIETCLQHRALLTGLGLDFAWLDMTRTPDRYDRDGVDRIAQTVGGVCIDTATIVCMLVDAEAYRQLVMSSGGATAGKAHLRLGESTLNVASCSEADLTSSFLAHGFSVVGRLSATEVIRGVNVNMEPRDARVADVVRFVVFRAGLRL